MDKLASMTYSNLRPKFNFFDIIPDRSSGSRHFDRGSRLVLEVPEIPEKSEAASHRGGRYARISRHDGDHSGQKCPTTKGSQEHGSKVDFAH